MVSPFSRSTFTLPPATKYTASLGCECSMSDVLAGSVISTARRSPSSRTVL